MGFFSNLVNFVKNVVVTLMINISGVFGGGATGVFIATLFVFVVAFVCLGPAALYVEFESSPWLFLLAHPVLTALVLNLVVQAISMVDPTIGRDLGYIIGVVSFIIVGFDVAQMYSTTAWSAEQAFAYVFPAASGLSAATVQSIYTIISNTVVTAWVAAMLTGPNAPWVAGLINGFFAVPTIVANAADAALGTLSSSMMPWLLLLGGGLLLLSSGKSTTVTVEGARPNGSFAY